MKVLSFIVKGCLLIINLLLGALALTLVVFLIMLKAQVRIQAPDVCLIELNTALKSKGIRLEVQTLSVDMTGGVFARQLKLIRLADSTPVIECESAFFRLNLWDAFNGIFEPEKLLISNAQLTLPPSLSPSATEKPLIKELSLGIEFLPKGYHCLYLIGKIHTLRFSASGYWFPESPSAHIGPSIDAEAFLLSVPDDNRLRQQIVMIFKSLTLFKHPIIQANEVSIIGNKPVAGTLDFIAEGLITPQLQTGSIRLQADLKTQALDKFPLIFAEAHTLKIPIENNVLKIERVDMSARPPRLTEGEDWLLTESIDAYLHDLSYKQWNVPWVAVSKESLKPESPIELISSAQTTSIEANLLMHSFTEGDGSIDAHITLQDNSCLEWIPKSIQPPSGLIDLNGEVQLRVNLAFHHFKPTSEQPLHFAIDASKITLSGALFQRIIAHGSYQYPLLDVSNIFGDNGTYSANGAYSQRFDNWAFQIAVKGSFYPALLNPILHQWWEHIFNPMKFHEPAQVDVSVAGNWGEDSGSTIHSYTYAYAQHMDMRVVPLESLELTARQYKGHVFIDNLVAKSQQKTLFADLHFIFPTHTEPTTRLEITANNTIPLSDIDKAFHLSLDPVLSLFKYTSDPTATIKGRFKETHSGQWSPEILNINALFPHQVTFKPLTFDRLNLDLQLSGHMLYINRIDGDLCGGQLNLEGNIDLENEKPGLFRFHCNLNDVHFPALMKQIDRSNQKVVSTESTIEKEYPAKIRAQSQISGKGTDKKTYTGTANFELYEADLGKVRILGGLSTLLDSIGIHLTTFVLDRAEGACKIEGETLNFERINIRGPALTIETKGTLEYITNTMDFNVKLFFLRNKESASLLQLFGRLLRPLGYVLEFKLTGNRAEPDWRFLIDPRNLLSGISDAVMPESKSK
jgi:hypothetical protein